jgi:lipopolysaccharide/colanic/teichoic acid biosynthesis glycosyltransferase
MAISDFSLRLSGGQAFAKRCFDICGAFIGLLLTWWLILGAWALSSLDTRSNGFFIQWRVGLHGRLFRVVKIKTMRPDSHMITTVTQRGDPRITVLGAFFRKTKVDELPQLWNVLIGDMSFVGPRPDVPGFADKLVGDDRAVLSLRPGVTGPSTIKYRYEEELLAGIDDPETFNRDVIWPDKVRINLEYIRNWRLVQDVKYIFRTLF